jgi:hypothetical protein
MPKRNEVPAGIHEARQPTTDENVCVENLVSMGYSKKQSLAALRRTKFVIDDALEYLFAHPDSCDDNDDEATGLAPTPPAGVLPPPTPSAGLPPPPSYKDIMSNPPAAGPNMVTLPSAERPAEETPPPSMPPRGKSHKQEMDNVDKLVCMGYDSAKAFIALKKCGFNVESAIEELTKDGSGTPQGDVKKQVEQKVGNMNAPLQISSNAHAAADFPVADFKAGKLYGHETIISYTFTGKQLGMQLVSSRGDYRKNCSHVRTVIDGGEASRLGIRANDTIIGFEYDDSEIKGLKRVRVCIDHKDTTNFLSGGPRPVVIMVARPTVKFPSRGWQSVPEYLPYTPMYAMGLNSYTNTCTVQVLRSVGAWSLGVTTEGSIHEAMLHAIKTSQHFVYIENQFFCTSIGSVKNKVGYEIRERIKLAMKKKERFRVMILLPLHPEGHVEEAPTKAVMHWQYASIGRGGKGLLEDLKKVAAKEQVDLDDYIGFYSLRKAGFLNGRFWYPAQLPVSFPVPLPPSPPLPLLFLL